MLEYTRQRVRFLGAIRTLPSFREDTREKRRSGRKGKGPSTNA